MSGLRSQDSVTTYGNNISNDVGIIAVASATRKRPDLVLAIVDGIDDLEDNLVGAVVVTTGVELGEESVALGTEVVEDGLQVSVRPLGDGTGQGQRTGGEDSEDSRETHGEDA